VGYLYLWVMKPSVRSNPQLPVGCVTYGTPKIENRGLVLSINTSFSMLRSMECSVCHLFRRIRMNDEQRAKCIRLLSEMLFTLTVVRPVRGDLDVIIHKCDSLFEVVTAAAYNQMDILDGKCNQSLS